MVADFDFRGLADILGSHAHIGFLEADSVRPKFSHLLPNLLIGLCIALSGCVAKTASSAKSMEVTQKYSFDFGLGEEASHPEELAIDGGTGLGTHRQWKSQRHGTRGGEEDSKECRG